MRNETGYVKYLLISTDLGSKSYVVVATAKESVRPLFTLCRYTAQKDARCSGRRQREIDGDNDERARTAREARWRAEREERFSGRRSQSEMSGR